MRSALSIKDYKGEYPQLGINPSEELVVLFNSPTCGMVVHVYEIVGDIKVGYFSTEWDPAEFVAFGGVVKLEN